MSAAGRGPGEGTTPVAGDRGGQFIFLQAMRTLAEDPKAVMGQICCRGVNRELAGPVEERGEGTPMPADDHGGSNSFL